MATLAQHLHIIDNLAAAYGDVTGTGRLAFTVDMLTDLIHWTARNDVQFDRALEFSRLNAEAEVAISGPEK